MNSNRCLGGKSDGQEAVVVISGPTGSGKTRLAIDLAERLEGEIINADSVQAYRGFDIGASKPSEEELARVSHHLLSFLEPAEEFNAGRFLILAREKIAQLACRKILPFVVGGTGLYIRALLCGLVSLPAPTLEVRTRVEEFEKNLKEKGLSAEEIAEKMYLRLQTIDQTTADGFQRNDQQRIRRALLVALSTGMSLRGMQDQHGHSDLPYRALVVILLPRREILYQAIESRVDRMFEHGLIDEVKRLVEAGCSHSKVFSSIGYRHVLKFLQGKQDYQELMTEMKRDTRHLAKRQMTWWRNQPKMLAWHDISSAVESGVGIASFPKLSEALETILRDFRDQRGLFSQAERGVDFLRVNTDYCLA